MTVDNPDKAVAVKDRQPAYVVFHEQFRGSVDRLPRCDSDNIRGHDTLDRRAGMVGNDRPYPPGADQVAPGDDPDQPFFLQYRERGEAALNDKGMDLLDLIILCQGNDVAAHPRRNRSMQLVP